MTKQIPTRLLEVWHRPNEKGVQVKVFVGFNMGDMPHLRRWSLSLLRTDELYHNTYRPNKWMDTRPPYTKTEYRETWGALGKTLRQWRINNDKAGYRHLFTIEGQRNRGDHAVL